MRLSVCFQGLFLPGGEDFLEHMLFFIFEEDFYGNFYRKSRLAGLSHRVSHVTHHLIKSHRYTDRPCRFPFPGNSVSPK